MKNRKKRRHKLRPMRGEQVPPTEETSVEGMDTSFDFTPPIQIGRGRKKTTKEKTPGENNLKLHVDRMSEDQLNQAMEAIAEDPTTITIVDNNGNEN